MANGKCDLCGCDLPKGRRRFCSNKHKDRYHNINNPRGYFDPAKRRDRVQRASEDEHSGLLRMLERKQEMGRMVVHGPEGVEKLTNTVLGCEDIIYDEDEA